MAINIDTMNLEEYPGISKRVTADQEQVIPYGFEGDEQIMSSFYTSAYSDNTARTRIQTYYVTSFKAGWCKSSGFTSNKIALDSTHNSIGVKLDTTVSGTDGSGYYTITLAHSNGLPLDAEDIAADMEIKIRAIADNLNTADTGFSLAYMNASVEYSGGRFWIISGSLSNSYTGASRSSVSVAAASSNDCSAMLGFDMPVTSEVAAGREVKEALVLTTFSGSTASGTGQITIAQNIGATTNDCLLITDGTNTDYFQVDSIVDNVTISFDASKVSNDYIASSAKVQLLREQDPDSEPFLWFNDIDAITRHGIKTIVNQIDYSS